MKCSACKAENAQSVAYCIQCGSPMAPGGGAELNGRRETGLEDGKLAGKRETEAEVGQVPAQKRGFVPSAAAVSKRKTEREEDESEPQPPPRRPQSTPGRNAPAPSATPAASAAQAPPQVGKKATQFGDDSAPPIQGTGYKPHAQQAPAAARHLGRVVGWMISFSFNPTGQEYVLREGRNRISKGKDTDISLFYDETVSDPHAVIQYRGGKIAIMDDGSTNGTFVNGEDIGFRGTAHPLVHGDVVKIGQSVFKVFVLDATEMKTLWPHLASK